MHRVMGGAIEQFGPLVRLVVLLVFGLRKAEVGGEVDDLQAALEQLSH